MQRKYVYGLLALPVILFLALLAFMPGETRATFFTEFKHRTRLMMGYKPEKFSDEKGLRSEHPEEYGQYDEVTDDSVTDGEDAETPSDVESPGDDDGDNTEEEPATEVQSTNDADGHVEDEHEAIETEQTPAEAASEDDDSSEAE